MSGGPTMIAVDEAAEQPTAQYRIPKRSAVGTYHFTPAIRAQLGDLVRFPIVKGNLVTGDGMFWPGESFLGFAEWSRQKLDEERRRVEALERKEATT